MHVKGFYAKYMLWAFLCKISAGYDRIRAVVRKISTIHDRVMLILLEAPAIVVISVQKLRIIPDKLHVTLIIYSRIISGYLGRIGYDLPICGLFRFLLYDESHIVELPEPNRDAAVKTGSGQDLLQCSRIGYKAGGIIFIQPVHTIHSADLYRVTRRFRYGGIIHPFAYLLDAAVVHQKGYVEGYSGLVEIIP